MDAKPKRRRFRYSLRTLLVFVAIASIPFAWMGHKVREKQREREVVKAIRDLGGHVALDIEPNANAAGRKPSPGPTWLRKLLGDDFFTSVVSVEIDSRYASHDIGLVQLRSLPQVRNIYLADPQFTDEELVQLRELARLKLLHLAGAQVTDQGCDELKRALPGLQIYR